MDFIDMLLGRRRYNVPLDTSDFPKKGERSIYLGKVAESSERVYYDIDNLTRHMIIAGITGGGKTVAGNIIIEEAVKAGTSVVIIDPTVQWSGILLANKDEAQRNRYGQFKMPSDESRGIPTHIIALANNSDFSRGTDLVCLMRPGIATVVLVNELVPAEIDRYIGELIKAVRSARLPQSKQLKLLIVFDEIHTILPKFGGNGKGFVELDRAVREFRELGVGMLLLSQVLEDFLGAIRGNINTEVQMRTTFDDDLAKAKLKYGEKVADSIMRCETGTGLFHNADYNIGRPFFLSFRPPYHNTDRLPDKDLNAYLALAHRIDDLRGKTRKDDEILARAEQELYHGNLNACNALLEDAINNKRRE